MNFLSSITLLLGLKLSPLKLLAITKHSALIELKTAGGVVSLEVTKHPDLIELKLQERLSPLKWQNILI